MFHGFPIFGTERIESRDGESMVNEVILGKDFTLA
jgi:hypothetical protein